MPAARESLVRVPLPLTVVTRENSYKDTTHPSIGPADLWQRTGDVKPGERGPGCGVGCGYCNQISLNTILLRDQRENRLSFFL
jgi:hypothetical protein